MILLLSGYDKRLPERVESAAGDRRRTPAPHSVSDVVRPAVVNAPLVNDIKRRGVPVPLRLRSVNTVRS